MVSKSVWNLPGGPWERLFAGVWNNFNVAVYENEEKILLTTIFPKTGEVNWIMIRVDKILLVPRDFEKIEANLVGKNMHVLKQNVPERHMTYVIVLSPPDTVEFGSKEIGSKVFEKVLKLNEEVAEIKKIAKRQKVEIIDLNEASYKDSANILGNPTTLLSLLSIAPEGEEPKKEKLREFVLGLVGEDLFKVNEEIFQSYSSIKKGSDEERSYLAQAITEDAIIDVTPIPLVLDFGKSPLKLDQANPYPHEYEKYGFDSHNVGFKIKKYDFAEDSIPIQINLNEVKPNFLWELFGLGHNEVSTLILQTINRLQKSGSIDGLEDIIHELKGTKSKGEANEVLVARSLRILRTIDKAYGPIFSKRSDLQTEVIQWIKNNETIYFGMSKLGKRKRLAIMFYILETLESMKSSEKLSSIEQKRLESFYLTIIDLGWFGEGLSQTGIVNRIINNQTGALFVNEEELPMKIESRVSNRFHITAPRKAKLYVGGRGQEFEIRPLLSCPP